MVIDRALMLWLVYYSVVEFGPNLVSKHTMRKNREFSLDILREI
jgi:hypothetical protein